MFESTHIAYDFDFSVGITEGQAELLNGLTSFWFWAALLAFITALPFVFKEFVKSAAARAIARDIDEEFPY